MISVNVKFIGNYVKSIEVKGHANSGPYGHDLVCAGVSAVVIGGINALEKEIKNIEVIKEENKLGVNVINSNSYIQDVLNTIIVQLTTIASSNPKNIKINK